jgi:hypothetical protein
MVTLTFRNLWGFLLLSLLSKGLWSKAQQGALQGGGSHDEALT